MVAKGPKNHIGLTDKAATERFRYYSQQYVTGLARQHYYSPSIWELEQYLVKKFHLKHSIYELLYMMLSNIQLMLSDDNCFRIIIPKHKLPNIEDMNCDELVRLNLYGNRNLKGTGLVEDIFKSIFIHF